MDKGDLAERLHRDAQGIDLGADGMGWGPDPSLLREAAAEVERLRAQNTTLKRDLQYARDGLTKGRTRMREDIDRLRRELKAAERFAKPLEPLDPLDVEELWGVANGDPYVDEVHQAFARLIERKHGIGG